jgi:hypothetical protein
MTPNEFKAWFDGFTEAFEGRIPTKAQWGRIKDRVAEIDGMPVTHTVYMDRYAYWVNTPSFKYPITTTTLCANPGVATNTIQASFNSSQAMAALGRAEAKTLEPA